jgi:hypothetical protein
MTEAEWNTCDDALAMLRFLRERSGERKLRLLACACARSRWSGLVEEEYRRAVEVAEQCADGLGNLNDLRVAEGEIWFLTWGAVRGDADANGAAYATVEDFAAHAGEKAVASLRSGAAELIREIMGNPFCDVVVDPGWAAANGGRLAAIAQRAYDEHRFEDLPLLADLLREAGCREDRHIDHLRSPGPHFRGCWALDALLGKGQGKDLVTEADWLNETHPFYMLTWWTYFRGEISPRKHRLLACACCRLIWHLFTDECLRQAIETAETVADGLGSRAELARLHEQAKALGISRGKILSQMSNVTPGWAAFADSWRVASAVALAARPDDGLFSNAIHLTAQDRGRGRDTEDTGQAALIREILGNPLRRVSLDPAWLRWDGGKVVQLAQAFYHKRSFDNLPILADALEEAGCTDAAILSHLRGPEPHVRGCWVLDLLLGKE